MRIEPPPSVACAAGTIPAATATDDPPEEPPDDRLRSQGLRVRPVATTSAAVTSPRRMRAAVSVASGQGEAGGRAGGSGLGAAAAYPAAAAIGAAASARRVILVIEASPCHRQLGRGLSPDAMGRLG